MDLYRHPWIFPLKAAEDPVPHHQTVFKGEGREHYHKLGCAKPRHHIIAAQAVKQAVMQPVHTIV